MSFGSSYDVKEQVRQATDLVDLVSRTVTLRRQGKMFVGICPWHDDARPSLQVNPERQSWKCWVCDVGGDVFSFVMKREGVDFPTALGMLAERAGISLRARGAPRTEPGSPNDKQTLYRCMAWAEQLMHRCLMEDASAQPARDYLEERGISPGSIERFHLGFSPTGWQWLLDHARTSPFSTAVLEAAGLVLKSQRGARYYDRFRGRLVFSIRDTESRPIAFGGRILPQLVPDKSSPKYVNSPETRIYVKSDHLYALDMVRTAVTRERNIVVVEGYTDVIMAHQCGLNQVVAVLGTALGPRHIHLLRRFADTVTLVLDGDEAGQRRTNEILGLFVAEDLDLRVQTLPSGLDPCDFLRREGAAAFTALLDQAVDALEHKIRVATRGIDPLRAPSQAHRALEDILDTLARAPALPRMGSSAGHLRQQQMVARLAHEFHVEEAALRERLAELRAKVQRRTSPNQPTAPQPSARLTPVEQELFEILVSHPALAPWALDAITSTHLTSPIARQLWTLYGDLQTARMGYEFQEVLTAAEDSALKNLLVQLDESAQNKANDALEDAEARLHGLIRDFEFQQQRLNERQALATLETHGYDEQEELALLEQIIRQERKRQGISAPTDG